MTPKLEGLTLPLARAIEARMLRNENESSRAIVISKLAALHVTVRCEDVPAFIQAAGLAGWSAVDSGERVTTEEGYAKEAVLVVRIPHFVEADTPTAV